MFADPGSYNTFCERSSDGRLVDPATGAPDGGFAWRGEQTRLRVAQALGALRSLLKEAAPGGDSPWAGRLDPGNVAMAGHSFGGATTVAACALGSAAVETVGAGFAGFRCGVVLDGWMFPLVGEPPDVGRVAAGPGAPPLLFVDAESFLGDRARWWGPKAELVRWAGSGSALVSMRHTAHHSFSDVLVLGGAAYSMIGSLRQGPILPFPLSPLPFMWRIPAHAQKVAVQNYGLALV